MIDGQLKIKPGFEAGSEFCGECRFCSSEWDHDTCTAFTDKLEESEDAYKYFRSHQCLDLEVK